MRLNHVEATGKGDRGFISINIVTLFLVMVIQYS